MQKHVVGISILYAKVIKTGDYMLKLNESVFLFFSLIF